MPKLSPADRKKLSAALEASKDLITASAIIEWLEKRDIHDVPNPAALQSHRKKTCTCFDDNVA
jgi:hypothetical protein